MTTWNDLRALAESRLTAVAVDAPSTEALWMLEDVSGISGADLRADGGEPATQRATAALTDMLNRRQAGEPLQYILGHWSFRGLDLLVDTRVLIPRPETEWVVECALEALAERGFARGMRNAWTGNDTSYAIADLGTGSGAIALSLAAELPHAEVWATDASADALAVARANVAGCGATRVRLAEGSWFDALPDALKGTLELVISNPPYVGADEWTTLDAVVRDHEPFSALVGGPDGFEPVADIIATAPVWLAPGATLIIEMAPGQTDRAVALALEVGYTSATIAPDLTGRARALIAHVRKDIP